MSNPAAATETKCKPGLDEFLVLGIYVFCLALVLVGGAYFS